MPRCRAGVGATTSGARCAAKRPGRHGGLPALAALLACVLCLVRPASAAAPPSAGAAPGPLDERRTALFAANCIQCHARPETGAPQLGDEATWASRRAQGAEALLRHTVLGVDAMPPLGYCSACSEADLRALIQFLSGAPAQ
jgi:cytochrome c5